MRAWIKRLFTPKVKVYNPDHSFVVSGVTRWRLCGYISKLPGIVFTRKPWLLGSSAEPFGEFRFREIAFQVDDGGDMGGDGLWVSPQDGLPHPLELREIREHIEKAIIEK